MIDRLLALISCSRRCQSVSSRSYLDGFSAHLVVADGQLENSHPIKLNREQKPSHSNQTLQNGAESIFRDALRERETDFLRGKTMALRIFKSIFGSPAAITPDPLLGAVLVVRRALGVEKKPLDRKSTRLNSSH